MTTRLLISLRNPIELGKRNNQEDIFQLCRMMKRSGVTGRFVATYALGICFVGVVLFMGFQFYRTDFSELAGKKPIKVSYRGNRKESPAINEIKDDASFNSKKEDATSSSYVSDITNNELQKDTQQQEPHEEPFFSINKESSNTKENPTTAPLARSSSEEQEKPINVDDENVAISEDKTKISSTTSTVESPIKPGEEESKDKEEEEAKDPSKKEYSFFKSLYNTFSGATDEDKDSSMKSDDDKDSLTKSDDDKPINSSKEELVAEEKDSSNKEDDDSFAKTKTSSKKNSDTSNEDSLDVPVKRKKPGKSSHPYTPDWESLDNRPLPDWYDNAKFGIFIHWGVYSVPAFGPQLAEWFYHKWLIAKDAVIKSFMEKNYPADFTYKDFAPKFTAEFFDPAKWANLFKNSGAKYVVLTSKHHDGYALWPSKLSPEWNSIEVGPKRDLVGELAKSIRSLTDLKFGLYHSLMEWNNPLYKKDQDNNWSSQEFVTSKLVPDLRELVEKYKPSVVWSDGDWDAAPEYWNSTNFLSWLYNDSPVKDEVVTNDRWGKGTKLAHGGVYTGSDRYNPGLSQEHKWENCFSIDKTSWGYRRNAELADYFSTSELITTLVTTVSGGGNLLLNVGPGHDGTISPIFEERLLDIGKWLSVNGEAIYGTRPWKAQKDSKSSDVWYTQGNDPSAKHNPVFATVLSWPKKDFIELSLPKVGPKTKVTFLGYDGDLKWEKSSKGETGIKITFPPKSKVQSDFAWVLRFDKLLED